MMKRRSSFSGEMVEMPAKPAPAPSAADQLADMRVLLATEQARREAAEARCADLAAQLAEAGQRSGRLADELERAHGRIESMAKAPAQIPLPLQQEPAPPAAYEAKVTKRDADGKIEKFEIMPRSESWQ